MFDNSKLLKDLTSIYSSSNKAKKSVIAELAKIDEKYRKLAEQEKAQLNKTLDMLDAQLKYYGALLNLDGAAVVDVPESVQTEEVEEEAKIEDTIFPENNEQAEEIAEEAVEEKTEEPAEQPAEVEAPPIDATAEPEAVLEGVAIEDIPEVTAWPEGDDVKVGADGWPEWPTK